MKAFVSSFVVLALVAAISLETSEAARAQPPSSAAAARPSGRSCFWIRNIRGFRSVDNRTVFVRVSGNDVFALELFSPCIGVDWAHRVALRARGSSSVCEGRANWVNLHVQQTGGRQGRCSVSNVRKLTPDEITALPRGARP